MRGKLTQAEWHDDAVPSFGRDLHEAELLALLGVTRLRRVAGSSSIEHCQQKTSSRSTISRRREQGREENGRPMVAGVVLTVGELEGGAVRAWDDTKLHTTVPAHHETSAQTSAFVPAWSELHLRKSLGWDGWRGERRRVAQ